MARTARRDEEACAAIEELGGTFAVAELLAIDPKVVSNWKTHRGFPSDVSDALGPLLKKKQFEFTAFDLFKQRRLATDEERERWRIYQAEQARINYQRKRKRKR